MRKNYMQLVTGLLTKSIHEKDVKFLEMNAEYSRILRNLDQIRSKLRNLFPCHISHQTTFKRTSQNILLFQNMQNCVKMRSFSRGSMGRTKCGYLYFFFGDRCVLIRTTKYCNMTKIYRLALLYMPDPP